MPASRKQKNSSRFTIFWLGPVLVVAGIIGLVWAIKQLPSEKIQSTSTGSNLQVQSGDSSSTSQGQVQAGSQLQGAAKVNDLIKGRDASDLQQGSAADALTKDATLQ